jgi:hypothetical protein
LQITLSAVSQQIAALECSHRLTVSRAVPRGVQIIDPGRILANATAGLIVEPSKVGRQIAAYGDGVSAG